MAENTEQGTGKHPHKDTSEPWRHTEDSRSTERSESRGEGSEHGRKQSAGSTNEGNPGSDSRDLNEREYQDNEGTFVTIRAHRVKCRNVKRLNQRTI